MIPQSHEISGLIRVPEMNGERSFALREISIFLPGGVGEGEKKEKAKSLLSPPFCQGSNLIGMQPRRREKDGCH